MARKRISKKIIEKALRLKQEIESDKVPVQTIYVFGSHAKGTAHKWSDIDMCVISSAFGKKIRQPMNYLWSKRVKLRDYEIEPVGFNPAEFEEQNSLISEIKKYGIRVA